MSKDMKTSSSPTDTVMLDKRQYTALQQRLVATQNLTIMLQEREEEVKRLTAKLKSMEQNLLATHKLLGQKTLKQGGRPGSLFQPDSGFVTNRFPGSITSPSSMSSVVIDGDGGVFTQQGHVVDHHSPVKGQGDSPLNVTSGIPTVVENKMLRQLSQESGCNDNNGNEKQDQDGLHSPSVSNTSNGYRKLQTLSDLWSMNSTVSQQNFYDVVKELKKTKSLLKESMISSSDNLLEVSVRISVMLYYF